MKSNWKALIASTVAASFLLMAPMMALADGTTAPTTTDPNATTTSTTTTAETTTTTADAGLTPESPFYFLDRLMETVQLFLTSDPEAKVNLYVEYADERLAELKVVAEHEGEATLEQQAAAQKLATDVIGLLGDAGAGLESLKIENGEVKVAAKVQETATAGETVVRDNAVLPATLISELLQTLNLISQNAQAVEEVEAEDITEAQEAGVEPGKLAVTVKMAETSGEDLKSVADLMNTLSATDVAQKLGLDPATLTKLEIKIDGSEIKISAKATSSVEVAPGVEGWNGQIALPENAVKILDFKYEAEDGKVEYKVTFQDANGNTFQYKYEMKDGKVEAKLEMLTGKSLSKLLKGNNGKALGKDNYGHRKKAEKQGEEKDEDEHADEHEEEND